MTSKQLTRFNLNDHVRVKLTDHGRKIHREQFRELNARLPLAANMQYTPPKEDAEGWSRWQLWELMSRFGEHIGMCQPNVFDLWIEFEADKGE
jgi:hypothetical protein